MKLAFNIALRYLFAKKSQNIINVISMISVIGILTGSAALIVVLSVFNGLHGFIGSLYSSFDPDIKISAIQGKIFSLDSVGVDKIKNIPGVVAWSEVLEDNALLKFSKRQMPATIIGVDDNYHKVTGIDTIMHDGIFRTKYKKENQGVLGYVLADQLSVRLNFVTPLSMYAPRRTGRINMANPQNAFRTEYISPVGIFMVKQIEYDSQYLIINIEQARRLFEYDSTVVSSLYLKVNDYSNVGNVKKQLAEVLGPGYKIADRQEQHASFYKMMQLEKLMAFLILSFILLIAAFNIIGTLSMLIYEKKESIFTFRSMGATKRLVTRIFLTEGWMISLVGVIAGLVIGIVLVLLQENYGLLKFQGGGSFIVDAYPVALEWTDVLLVLVTVSTIGLLGAWYPVKVIVDKYYTQIGR
ncbi:MAG: FtsX-like permease family protein [Chlorobi bacterium]|nr:FtsX-like permease family protein [Chlorobiota bacterium]